MHDSNPVETLVRFETRMQHYGFEPETKISSVGESTLLDRACFSSERHLITMSQVKTVRAIC